jgi:ubiquinone/menaquinone biosynthesis C-methylase UbiE
MKKQAKKKPIRRIEASPGPRVNKDPMTTLPVCPWWIRFILFAPLRRMIDKPEQLLAEWVETGMVAADIGCGTGYLTVPLAKLVEDKGKVFAIDLQAKMLNTARLAAEKAGVEKRITFQLAQPGSLGKLPKLDFALTAWMLHEVLNPRHLLQEIRRSLHPGGKYLFLEPIFHVSAKTFQRSCALIESEGFQAIVYPSIALSHAALFQ